MSSFASSCIFLALTAARVAADLAILTDDYEAYNAGAYGICPNQTFISSDIIGPRFHVNTWDKRATGSASHIFLTPTMPDSQRGPMILSSKDLSLVYADPSHPGISDAKIQMIDGQPYMTFWSGHDLGGHGSGAGIIVDQNYRVVHNITTQGLTSGADSHEFQLTNDGGALLNVYETITYDTSSVGGPVNGTLLDCAFQEIDIKTGGVRFQWRATDHFDLTESQAPGYEESETGWDWFHMNSLYKTHDGNYLIDARHLKLMALINGTDGSRIWQIGGHNNSFTDLSSGHATNFQFQHHARFVDDTHSEITLFDNHAMWPTSSTPGCTHDCTRAMRIALDYENMTVQLVSAFYHSKSVQAWAEGGYHLLPNGNAMIGWGVVGGFSEIAANGTTVMEVQYGPWSNIDLHGKTQLYRVYSFDWVATPTWPPSIGIADSTVYVSWNGATEVASWVLYGGNSTNTLEPLVEVPRAGFETAITPPEAVSYARVIAMAANGTVLGSTHMIEMESGARAVVQPTSITPSQSRLFDFLWG